MNATRRSTASSSPSNTASTAPSQRFVTDPATPCCCARRRVESRKNTPCTCPWTTTRRRITRRIVAAVDFQEILKRRRMVRAYEPEPVPRETLERLVATIRRAPSAGFSQGQRLIVVTEPERRHAIAKAVGEEFYVHQGFAPWISGAAALVAVATREGDYHDR